MTLFLKILIIVGKVLIGVLLGLLSIVFLILFVPIFYKAKASYKESKVTYSVKASWLFGFVSFSLSEVRGMHLMILFFDFLDKEKNESVENKKASKEEDDIKEDINIEALSCKEDDFHAKEENFSGEELSEGKESNLCGNCSESSIKSEPSKNKERVSTKTNLYDRIKKYIGIIKSENFKKAFSKAKKLIFDLLLHILPRKWEVNGTVGFDDPSVTGEILAILGILYPVISKHIHVRGDFENSIIDINGYAKGHIVLIKILVLGGILYFNRRIRRVIKLFREDKNV